MFWNLSIVVRSQVSSFIKIHWIVQFKLYINKVDKNIFQVFISSEMYSFIGNMQKNKFSCSVVSDSLWPHGLHYARLPCPSPTPGACSNSCLSSWWCHPIVSSSVVPFSSCLQSFPASGSFPVSQFFISDGQSIAVSASASVLPMNIQDWFPLGLTGLSSSERTSLTLNQKLEVIMFTEEDIESWNRPNLAPCTKQQSCGCKASSWGKLKVLFQWTHEWW